MTSRGGERDSEECGGHLRLRREARHGEAIPLNQFLDGIHIHKSSGPIGGRAVADCIIIRAPSRTPLGKAAYITRFPFLGMKPLVRPVRIGAVIRGVERLKVGQIKFALKAKGKYTQ